MKKYYYTDALGSIRSVVNSSGTVLKAHDFYPFGLPMPSRNYGSGTRERFTGQERDGETGLDYFGARYYMPALGRWTSVDPLEDLYTGVSPYVYVLNNPAGLTDPDGRCATCIGFVLGGAIGAGVAYFQGKDVSTGFWSGAAAGAIAGAFVDAVPTGGGGLLLVGAATAGGATGAAIGNVIDQVGNNMASGQDLGSAAHNINGQQVGIAAAVGAVAGVAGGAVGAVVDNVAASTPATIEAGKEALNSVSSQLFKQGASTSTVNAAQEAIVNGMHSAAVNTANTVLRVNAAATATTTITSPVLESQLNGLVNQRKHEEHEEQ